MRENIIKILCFCCVLFVSQEFRAQAYSDSENSWFLGFGFNAIYDSGEQLKGLFDIKDNYHYRTPLRVFIEKRYRRNYGIEVSANYNKFLTGKILNGIRLTDDIDFLAIDAMLKYYFTNKYLVNYRSGFEGFMIGGFGNNLYDFKWGMSANIGLGINYFINDDLILTGQGIAKFSVVDPISVSDFLHFNIGLIKRL